MRWAFIIVRNNVVEKVKIFDDYFVGETYINEYLRIAFGVNEVDFPEYRKGECYSSECNGVKAGLYKDSCQQAVTLV